MTHFRERAEREKEAAKNKENVDSDDEDVVFGNVSATVVVKLVIVIEDVMVMVN